MKYKCCECGEVFDEDEVQTWDEYRGECFGFPAYETLAGCPQCGEAFEEAYECKGCGRYFLSDELFGDVTEGYCADCLEDYRYDFETCYEISDDDGETVEINSFLASMFTTPEINSILFEALYERNKFSGKPVDCKEFIDDDREWFAEKLLEREREVKE